jgi:hypothetical protein
MMNCKTCIDELLKNFQDFKDAWKAHKRYWAGGKRSVGIDLNAFIDFISDKLEKKENYDYKKVFDFIEKLVVTGDEAVGTAATTMFLEGLVNMSSNGCFPSRSFTKYLGPESKSYCIAWDDFMGGDKTDGLYDDCKLETKTSSENVS